MVRYGAGRRRALLRAGSRHQNHPRTRVWLGRRRQVQPLAKPIATGNNSVPSLDVLARRQLPSKIHPCPTFVGPHVTEHRLRIADRRSARC